MSKTLVYKFISCEGADPSEYTAKCGREYFWKSADGTLSAPLTMAERIAASSGDDDDDSEDRQWAAYNRYHDR